MMLLLISSSDRGSCIVSLYPQHSFSWYWNFIIFLLNNSLLVLFSGKRESRTEIWEEKASVYIFINEEIYFCAYSWTHFRGYKKMFSVFAASHTNSQCKYGCDGQSGPVGWAAFALLCCSLFIKMVLWCVYNAYNTICVSDMTFLLHFYGACACIVCITRNYRFL